MKQGYTIDVKRLIHVVSWAFNREWKISFTIKYIGKNQATYISVCTNFTEHLHSIVSRVLDNLFANDPQIISSNSRISEINHSIYSVHIWTDPKQTGWNHFELSTRCDKTKMITRLKLSPRYTTTREKHILFSSFSNCTMLTVLSPNVNCLRV